MTLTTTKTNRRDVFTCALCGETFVSAWTEREALAEKELTFPDVSIDDCVVLCDDCYKKVRTP